MSLPDLIARRSALEAELALYEVNHRQMRVITRNDSMEYRVFMRGMEDCVEQFRRVRDAIEEWST